MRNTILFTTLISLLIMGGLAEKCDITENHAICVGPEVDLTTIPEQVTNVILNRVKRLTKDNVPPKSNIQELTLKSSPLEEMERGFISSLMSKEKQKINIKNMPITLKKDHLCWFLNLEVLRIYDTNKMDDDVFGEISSLSELAIVGVELENLPSSTSPLISKSLKILDLENSKIENPPWNIISRRLQTSTRDFTLKLKNMNVSCENPDLIKLYKARKAEKNFEVKCISPPSYTGKALKDLKDEDFEQLSELNTGSTSAQTGTVKANIEIIAVIATISILAFLLFTIFIIFRFCRKRNGKGKDFQKSSSHTKQIERPYEPLEQGDPLSL